MPTVVNMPAGTYFPRGEWRRNYGSIPPTFTTVTLQTDAGMDGVFWAIWDNAAAQDFDLLKNNGALITIPIPPGCTQANAQLLVRNPCQSRFVLGAS